MYQRLGRDTAGSLPGYIPKPTFSQKFKEFFGGKPPTAGELAKQETKEKQKEVEKEVKKRAKEGAITKGDKGSIVEFPTTESSRSESIDDILNKGFGIWDKVQARVDKIRKPKGWFEGGDGTGQILLPLAITLITVAGVVALFRGSKGK